MTHLDNSWSPWERIIRAADRGTGLRLSPSEVAQLGMDGAIAQKAQNDSSERVNCECGKPIPEHRRSKGNTICAKPNSEQIAHDEMVRSGLPFTGIHVKGRSRAASSLTKGA